MKTPLQQRKYLNSKRLSKYGNNLINCKECSLAFVKLGSHVVQVHGYKTAREYRVAHGLDPKTGKDMTIASHRKIIGKNAKKNGTVENLKEGARFRFREGDGRARDIVKGYWKYKSNVLD